MIVRLRFTDGCVLYVISYISYMTLLMIKYDALTVKSVTQIVGLYSQFYEL